MAVNLCGQNNQTAESLPHDVVFWEAPQGLKQDPLRVINTTKMVLRGRKNLANLRSEKLKRLEARLRWN